ncbi:MAG: Dihydrolipoyllysine-residue succinyltransferase component of 2-oxoglutarate dehydrogenase complex [Alphaproteobacteria bacterium MarineAlpha9_Bin4]|nr:MAG: Dihydrolipoyllysine-residue succinyltransferase component of 2-oxoglutarate dehydrogenase complex [Alphaproteobacteria bacterium MarineAlpha9_Bin4]
MKKIEIQVPALGESITEATVSKWFKKRDDFVKKDEVLLELETDKVSQEIYALDSGVLTDIFFQEGEDVKIGETLAKIEISDNPNNNIIRENEKNSDTKNTDSFFDVIIPSLGESITEATIGKWIKSEGENITKGEAIVEIETDKVTQELYAENGGVLEKIFYKENEEVKIGEIIAKVNETKEANKNKFKEDKKDNTEIAKESIKKIETNNKLDPTTVKRSGIGSKISLIDLKEFSEELIFSPAAKRIIREKNLDTRNLNLSDGSNRVNKSDVIQKNLNNPSLENNTDVEKPLSKLRQSIASRLKQAQNTAAMLTTFNEIDMFKIIDIRKKYKEKFLDKYGVKLGFMSFFTKAAIIALKDIPDINAEIKGSSIIYKNRYDIGIAVGTDKGLFVPVIKNADKMTFADIENEIINYGKMAKDNKLTLDHMKNGTFTISNGGVYGSMLSTPILNTPQSGILGLHNIVKRPWVVNEQIEIRPIMYVALTYDHRIVDGKEAVTFLVRIKEIIENPEQLIFEL